NSLREWRTVRERGHETAVDENEGAPVGVAKTEWQQLRRSHRPAGRLKVQAPGGAGDRRDRSEAPFLIPDRRKPVLGKSLEGCAAAGQHPRRPAATAISGKS